MKSSFLLILSFVLVVPFHTLIAQDAPVKPSLIGTGTYYGLSQPLSDIPALSAAEYQELVIKAETQLNPELRERSYPFASTALPKGPDPAWQKVMGNTGGSRAPSVSFDGQASPYFPPDDNCAVGPNHIMQTVNTVYAIYNKAGALVAGPTNLNLLFSGVTGSNYNDGDPIVLYDEQADRWLVAEFSIGGANDYMLVAVSQTNDPTGLWHKYSFDVANMPDYPKFGIWQDGYYMGTNNSTGNDIYVFERSKMLLGQTAQMVGFNNPWRPTTMDGFMCVPPIDNDGTFAPAGSPGLFVTINDDAIAGGSDQLWIYELAVNWTNPASSTFTRSQQINVLSFDSNFGANWDNIKQPGTTRELDAIPQVVMNVPQYRNFGSYQTIVCCHTVDVDNTDHAGIRWYELRKTNSTWTIRQQGTYAPDIHSRWMGSICMNGAGEIGLGYSISSTSLYPGIRYCGQSSASYSAGNSTLDIPEDIIMTGSYPQTSYNRWGDYSSICVDKADDETFWYTNEYIGTSQVRKTRIASFQIGTPPSFPDLITENPSADPSSISAGQSISVSCNVRNQGVAAAGASMLKYYFSTDITYNSGDTYLGEDAVSPLAADAFESHTATLTIPSSASSGTWYLIFFADATGVVAESNETNNTGYVQITVAGLGCNSSVQYPTSTITPKNTWKYVTGTSAGKYAAFNVKLGNTYAFSLCTEDGANAGYDSEMTLRNKANDAFIAYNDNNCGDDAKITWTATFSGAVKVVITQKPCVSNNVSTKFGYIKLSKESEIIEPDADQKFIVYPNPTSTAVYLESSTSFENVSEIGIYSMNGVLVMKAPIPDKSRSILLINMESLRPGFYSLRISGQDLNQLLKVIKTE